MCFLKAQVPTKTIDSYGVKFIVAEKVPEELKFLMGSYKDVNSDETIKLNSDGTITLGGKNFKYWFECTDDNFIAKMSYLNGSFSKNIPKSEQSHYSQMNLLVARPYKLQYSSTLNGKTYLGKDSMIINFSIVRILISFEAKKAFVDGSYSQQITGDLQKFNNVSKNGPIAPLRTDTKEFCDCISIQENL